MLGDSHKEQIVEEIVQRILARLREETRDVAEELDLVDRVLDELRKRVGRR